MEMMLEKKQIWVVFLFNCKMNHKAVETTHNINSAFGPRTANECTGQWWFKKLYKGDERLEDKEHSGWPSEVDNDQLRGSWKLILLQLHEKLPKNSTSTILQSFFIWSKLEKRWKSLISGCLMSWLEIKNIVVLKCHLPFILHNNEPFLNQIVTKSRLYTTGNDLFSGWTKKVQSTSQSQTCTKRRSCSLFGVPLLVWSTTAFWIPVKPLYLISMLSKSMRCTENCNTYS